MVVVKLSRDEHLRIEAEKRRKSIPTDFNSVDFKNTDLLEKALYNSKIETEYRKPENKQGYEDQKFDLEFHEQFFS